MALTFEYGAAFQDGMRGSFTVLNVQDLQINLRANIVRVTFLTPENEVKIIEKTYTELIDVGLRK